MINLSIENLLQVNGGVCENGACDCEGESCDNNVTSSVVKLSEDKAAIVTNETQVKVVPLPMPPIKKFASK
tara:strand:+ start:415 stop:627 length:213 start_codon:yes stop_codon:yes gene_type:complete